ncbi:unnamed protein product [Rotaria magnacalcarata]|uniref:Endonuclease/exonuclease/phosphatase domain-containing protein n=1 Tax=Rotaria magnacalcarata TaxID=392030 RepID=A0A817ANG4_9BILA|nr:unnamed protein product [Rotaria magnacalcarata]
MNFHSYHSVYPVLHRGNGLSAQQATTTNINGSEAITKINLGLILRDLKSDYSARRKRNTSPPPQLSPSQQPSQSLNINPNNDLDQNRGTNKSGEVCAAIGKHLKGTRIEINVENTVIIDANGLSETIRVIAIYRPAGQIMKLEELEPYISENTIITGDFNASIKECGSESSDKRGSSLSPYLFIVYHCDLVTFLGAYSSHIFADDLNVLISPPICRGIKPMLKLLEDEGTKLCSKIANYSKKWKQPINLSKTVVQVFHPQVQNPVVDIYMEGKKLEVVKEFKYLGFTWINKMSLKPLIDKTLENIQRTFSKLRWMKGGKTLSKDVL